MIYFYWSLTVHLNFAAVPQRRSHMSSCVPNYSHRGTFVAYCGVHLTCSNMISGCVVQGRL